MLLLCVWAWVFAGAFLTSYPKRKGYCYAGLIAVFLFRCFWDHLVLLSPALKQLPWDRLLVASFLLLLLYSLFPLLLYLLFSPYGALLRFALTLLAFETLLSFLNPVALLGYRMIVLPCAQWLLPVGHLFLFTPVALSPPLLLAGFLLPGERGRTPLFRRLIPLALSLLLVVLPTPGEEDERAGTEPLPKTLYLFPLPYVQGNDLSTRQDLFESVVEFLNKRYQLFVVLPEAPWGSLTQEELEILKGLALFRNHEILVGGWEQEGAHFYNRYFWIAPYSVHKVSKTFLVPFGERPWFRGLTPSHRLDFPFSPGEGRPYFFFRGHRIGVALCWEVAFPLFFAGERISLLLNPSNDRWLTLWGSRLFGEILKAQALAYGVDAVRISLGGLSGVVRPQGRWLEGERESPGLLPSSTLWGRQGKLVALGFFLFLGGIATSSWMSKGVRSFRARDPG